MNLAKKTHGFSLKKIIQLVIIFQISLTSFGQTQQFESSDINRFWEAYDKISTTKDSVLQVQYLQELYIDKASEGLKSLMEVRNYSPQEFISAIQNYPEFWSSLRENSLNTQELYAEIDQDIIRLRKTYPALKPATIYFLIGAFRTNGTIQNDKILIGSEMSLGNETTVFGELPEYLHTFYKEFKPKKNIALLCTHEYIHTQQKTPLDNLLSYCIYEGAAEYISCLATGKKSNTPAIAFGKANQEQVVNKFMQDIFSNNFYNWLWGENTNELKVRDLGYYIGYEICERYYNLSDDKAKAIRELIELDYTNEKEVERLVDTTKIFSASLQEMWDKFEKERPKVVKVKPLKKNKKLKPGLIQLEINFSKEMDPNYRGFDFGPLGENHIFKFKQLIGWSKDNKTITIEVEADPNKKIQCYVTSEFSDKNGLSLKPYLIEFETKK